MSSTAGMPVPPLTATDLERFWSKVDQTGDCWVWTAGKRANGYGSFSISGSNYRAHRIAYTLANGQIPAGLVLDHLCRNRACVNPTHLNVVSQRENVMRGEGVTAQCAKATMCVNGHLFDEANTYRTPNGRRACRTCQRERGRAYHARKRTAAAA